MIEIKTEQMERVQAMLGRIPGAVPKAVANAINRAAQGGRTDAVKKANEKYVIKTGRVRETMEVKQANSAKLSASIISRGRTRALSYFKITPSKPPQRLPKVGVHAQAIRSRSGGIIRRSFVAKMASGHIGVFHRIKKLTDRGEVEVKLHQHYGPSVPQMIGSKSVRTFVEEGAQRRLDERLDQEINRILKGYGK